MHEVRPISSEQRSGCALQVVSTIVVVTEDRKVKNTMCLKRRLHTVLHDRHRAKAYTHRVRCSQPLGDGEACLAEFTQLTAST